MATHAANLPFLKRFKLYLDERFPLATHLVVVIAFFFSSYLLSEKLLRPGESSFGMPAIAGMVTVLFALFFLRVLDEFKDYDKDLVGHPDRIVSQGIMPLSELKTIGIVVVAVMLLLNAWVGLHALAACLVVIGFALLMFKEFFIGEWLNKHLVIYALTHQLITPLICLYVYTLVAFPTAGGWNGLFWLQLAMGAGTGLGWEMSRKIRFPEEEHDQVDTYSKHFGYEAASALAFTILMAGAVCALALAFVLRFPPYVFGLFVLGLTLTEIGFVRFWRKPTAKGARKLGDWAAIMMLTSYLTVALGSLAGQGFRLTF
jgi:4-hydroxybenzoate polyprenyltransferase